MNYVGDVGGAHTLESIERRLSRLEDVEEIRNLKERYAHFCDQDYDPDGIASLFTEDAKFESNGLGNHYGREAIREFMGKVSSEILWAQHFMIAPRIDVAEDGLTATGTWYLLDLVTMTGLDDPAKPDAVIITANYRDEYAKVDGEWKFKSVLADIKMVSNLDRGWAAQPLRGAFASGAR